MRMFPRERNSYFSHSTTKSCMDSKSLKLWKKLAEIGKAFLLARCIPLSTVLSKKDSLNLDGEMKPEKSVEEPDDATTGSPEAELPPLMQSKPSEPTCRPGNLFDLSSIDSLDQDELADFLEEKEEQIELFEQASDLAKRSRKYSVYDPAETWASCWVASPIAYLLPAESREEWLGDLYEVNREMLHKGYPRWFINLINVGRTVVLIVSAIQIKITDFISFGLQRSK